MWNGMELSWGAYLKVLLNRELIWSESCLIWGWLHFLRVLVSLRRRGVRMQVRNKSAFTEAWLDLQFNAARIKKKKTKKTNKLLGWGWMPGVTGFFCSSDYSSSRRLWIWAEKEAFKCILCHSGERVDSKDCITNLISRRSMARNCRCDPMHRVIFLKHLHLLLLLSLLRFIKQAIKSKPGGTG